MNVDAPRFCPHDGVHGPIALVEFAAEGLLEARLENGEMDEEVIVFSEAKRPVGIESCPGHDAMDMRVEEEQLVPSLKDEGKAAHPGTKPFAIGKLLGKRA